MDKEQQPPKEKNLLFPVKSHDSEIETTNEYMDDSLVEQKEEEINKVVQEETLTVEQTTNEIKETNYRYGGFWMRFWAYLVDLIVIGSIVRLIINPIFRIMDISLTSDDLFAPITIVTSIIFYAYFVLMTKFFGQTIGKMIFGLRVISLEGKKLDWSTVLFREWIGRFISVSIVVLYIITAFTEKKQAVHDLFVSTTVIHE